jgi:CIC family chloride channel protein
MTPSANPTAGQQKSGSHGEKPVLSDFSTNRRVLLICLLAVPIGAMGSAVAKALLWLIDVFTNAAFYLRWSSAPVVPAGNHLGLWVVIVPVIGALGIGLMARFGSEKIRGHGIPEALEAILLGRSLINPRVAVLKPISSALSIGTGGPFGAEGPIIMTGGAIGSLFAQRFSLSASERKTLLVAGAAAGMAAIFATPVASVLLAVELLLFEWKPRSFIPVTVASIVASFARIPLLGAGPVFPVLAHAALSSHQVLMALAVGILAGLGSCALTSLVYLSEDLFARLRIHWMWWPALGGLVVGIGGFIDPRVLGVGYGTIHSLMLGQLLGATLVALVVAKSIVWAVALGSGTSGGVLAPLLMIGGGIGALFGVVTGIGDPGLWAMVGMAGMMGGAMRAPLTGAIFVLELTHDLAALPGLLVGSVAALCVTVLVLRRSILTEKLARRGQHVACEYSVDTFELIRVSDVMDRNPPLVRDSMTVAALSEEIARYESPLARRQASVIVDECGRLAGIITRDAVTRALLSGGEEQTTVLELAGGKVEYAYPDETLQAAVRKMLRVEAGRLPVIERSGSGKVIGYLGRAEILAARSHVHDQEDLQEKGPSPFGRGHTSRRRAVHPTPP